MRRNKAIYNRPEFNAKNIDGLSGYCKGKGEPVFYVDFSIVGRRKATYIVTSPRLLYSTVGLMVSLLNLPEEKSSLPFFGSTPMVKRLLSFMITMGLVSSLSAQRDIEYPSESYLGGGIGNTPTFLLLDVAPAFPFNITGEPSTSAGLLDTSGLNFDDLSPLGTMLVLHGVEGFGNITGNWRVGAYVGLGSNSVTRVDSATQETVDLKLTLMNGSASIEYVIPLFSNLEIAAGSLFGYSRSIIQFAHTAPPLDWSDQFTGSDTTNTMVALSGTFFSFQPYVALKLQFLDRAGLRMSAGYQIGTLPANQWTLNDFQKIIAPSEGNFNAVAVRVMLYLGI